MSVNKTQNIKEENESIFVCYLCEKEFSKVELLNNHMRTHAHDYNENEDSPVEVRKGKKKKKIHLNAMDSADIISQDYKISSTQRMYIKNFVDTKMKRMFSNKFQKNPEEISPDSCEDINYDIVKNEMNKTTNGDSTRRQNVVITPVERALRLQMLIQSREKQFKIKSKDVSSEPKKSSVPRGAVIMNTEPEGFMCPNSMRFNNDSSLCDDEDVEVDTAVGGTIESDCDFFRAGSASVISSSRSNFCKEKSKRSGRGRPPGSKKMASKQRSIASVLSSSVEPSVNIKGISEGVDSSKPVNRCSMCLKEFDTFSALRSHFKTHQSDREIGCPYCTNIYSQRHLLYEHLIDDHEESLHYLFCNLCNKVFTRPDSLKSHMVRLHGEVGGVSCTVCKKNFPGHAQLEMHMRTHTGERPFTCTLCNRSFVQKAHLKTHLRTMHSVSDHLTTPCQICFQMLSGPNALRKHFMSVHRMTAHQYKSEVNKFKTLACRSAEKERNVVRVVNPNLTYHKVLIDNVDGTVKRKRPSVYKKKKVAKAFTTPSTYPKVLDPNDDVMFSPADMKNEEEMKLVESAFQVADEIELLHPEASGDEPSSSGIQYFNLTEDINSTMEPDDDEEIDLVYNNEAFSFSESQQGKVVLAESLEGVDSDGSHVEMLSM